MFLSNLVFYVLILYYLYNIFWTMYGFITFKKLSTKMQYTTENNEEMVYQ